jgi:CheY-like chemotaxis protein
VSTILCVDDNPHDLSLVTALFETQGYFVLSTDDPQEALNWAKGAVFDLAILDYELPSMNGTTLARKLKRISPRIPILLFSGALSIAPEELFAFDEYIAKGESPGMLLFKTRCLLEPAQARAASA